MKRLAAICLLLAACAFPLWAQEAEWKQAPTELSMQGFFQQASDTHNWNGYIVGSMLSQISEHTLIGGGGTILWARGANGYLVGPSARWIYPVGLRDWDLVLHGDANATAGDLREAATWQAVTGVGMRRHLGTQGSSIEPGLQVKRAFGPDPGALDQVGFYLSLSLGINPPAAP